MYIILIIVNLGNTFNEEKFREMISQAIKEKEEFIIGKNSMVITADSRIVNALNSSSMLSSMPY